MYRIHYFAIYTVWTIISSHYHHCKPQPHCSLETRLSCPILFSPVHSSSTHCNNIQCQPTLHVADLLCYFTPFHRDLLLLFILDIFKLCPLFSINIYIHTSCSTKLSISPPTITNTLVPRYILISAYNDCRRTVFSCIMIPQSVGFSDV